MPDSDNEHMCARKVKKAPNRKLLHIHLLDQMLDNGEISQEIYDREMTKLDKNPHHDILLKAMQCDPKSDPTVMMRLVEEYKRRTENQPELEPEETTEIEGHGVQPPAEEASILELAMSADLRTDPMSLQKLVEKQKKEIENSE